MPSCEAPSLRLFIELKRALASYMKKPRSDKKTALARVIRRRTQRGLASKRVAHKMRFASSVQPGQLRSHRKSWQRGNEPKLFPRERLLRDAPVFVLGAPRQFTLSTAAHRAALLQFLSKLKRLTVHAGQRVKIDFRSTEKMYPDGTLLFAAELDTIVSSALPRCLVRCDRPRDDVVAQLLQQLGLAEKMKLKDRTPITAENVKYWRVKSDTLVDGSHTESLIEEYKHHFPEKESAKLYEGLTEAMTNAKQHAYDTPTANRLDKRWWMFSQMRDGKLSVSFCDRGIGFRNSLRSQNHWASDILDRTLGAIGFRRNASDSHYIKAAFEIGKSKTREPHRGKGLQELKKVIETVGGSLRILSHRGMYGYRSPEGKEDLNDFGDTVNGTVISWQVTVPEGSEA